VTHALSTNTELGSTLETPAPPLGPPQDDTVFGDDTPTGPPADDQPATEPVNPVEAAAALIEEQQVPEPPAPTPITLEYLPTHLVELRNRAAEFEREYDDAAETAKSAKKAWEAARDRFEGAFDAEVRRLREGKTPGLPFDGVHMQDTLKQQAQSDAAPADEPATKDEPAPVANIGILQALADGDARAVCLDHGIEFKAGDIWYTTEDRADSPSDVGVECAICAKVIVPKTEPPVDEPTDTDATHDEPTKEAAAPAVD
jgi:hypothetical protein